MLLQKKKYLYRHTHNRFLKSYCTGRPAVGTLSVGVRVGALEGRGGVFHRASKGFKRRTVTEPAVLERSTMIIKQKGRAAKFQPGKH